MAASCGPYEVALSRRARRNLHEDLPLEVEVAALETIQRAIAVNRHRVGKPLDEHSTASTRHAAGPTAPSTGSTRPSIW